MDVKAVSDCDNMRLLCAPELATNPLEFIPVSTCHKCTHREVLCPDMDVAHRSDICDIL